jgi:hypothetical protein
MFFKSQSSCARMYAWGSVGGAVALYFVFPDGKRFAKASIHAAAWNSPL